jgi:uncharacterized protein YbjT (DUF2867 family)
VTNFWEHFSPEKELEQAKNMARAAKAAGVTHVIWSTLEDTRKKVPLSDNRMPTLQEKYKVPHFDAKGEADAFFAETCPTTLLRTSYYWDNMIFFGTGPKRGEDGKLQLVMPMGDAKLPGIAVEDIGKCALGIFKDPSFIGKSLGIAGEHLTGAQMAEQLSRALEQPVAYTAVPPEVFAKFGFPGADDMANMYQFKRDFETEYCAARPLDLARKLNPELQTFSQWLSKNKSKIPLD